MKSRSILIIAAIFIVAIVGVGACSAGLFDFLGGNNNSNANLTGQEVNLAAAASLKNVYDEKYMMHCGEGVGWNEKRERSVWSH